MTRIYRTGLLAHVVLAAVLLYPALSSAQESTVGIKAVTVSADSYSVAVEGQLQCTAVVIDSSDAVVDTTVVWSVSDEEIGSIDKNGLFTALEKGEVTITATVGEVTGTLTISVFENENGEQGGGEQPEIELTVLPDEAAVVKGETVQFQAWIKDANGDDVDAAVTWSVDNTDIATIDENGLFTALAPGEAIVTAESETLSDSAEVTVTEEPPQLPEGVNLVNLFRQFPDGKITKFGSAFAENDTVTIGGIPSPMNFLNGMKLYFPENSLNEDITITFKIPKFAKIDTKKKEVTFGEGIAAGITFEVSVSGEVKSPYYFDQPLELSLPYKRGLLAKLNIDPLDLGMFFANDEGEIESDPGVTDISVDLDTNLITGKVAHFSTIVLASKESVPTLVEDSDVPAGFSLTQNVPNPFNPTTTIMFGIPVSSQVKLLVYNVIGQEVRTLVNEKVIAGTHAVVWDGTDNYGNPVTSGLYIYRLQAKRFSASKKLMLMK